MRQFSDVGSQTLTRTHAAFVLPGAIVSVSWVVALAAGCSSASGNTTSSDADIHGCRYCGCFDAGAPPLPEASTGAPADSGTEGGTSIDASTDGRRRSVDASTLTPPSPAAAAGFDKLVFDDDFTRTDTIATAQNATSGFKWYWSFDDATNHPWSVQTGATASSISNGNTSGGSNASPNGGILTLTGPGSPNDGLITVPGWPLNKSGAVLPAEGDGCWSHAYFEAYLQFRIDGNASTDPSNGWPAFWSWSAQALGDYGFGGSSLTEPNYSEIDFMEEASARFSATNPATGGRACINGPPMR